MATGDAAAEKVKRTRKGIERLKSEVSKVIIGQEKVLDAMIRALLANGHALVEGMPGVAKTLLIKALAKAAGGEFGRIQFTVDMLPSDIVGMVTYHKGKGFVVIRGPIFANFIIADEINRAPPKTQSAMLEAMQEKQVTISKKTYALPNPFFVMANNNPIESSGTYPLPEAQIDRFIFKIIMGYPNKVEEMRIMEENTSLYAFEEFKIRPVLSPNEIVRMQQLTKRIGHREPIKSYIAEIVNATRHPDNYGLKLGKFIEYGASPRASINLFIGAKAEALMRGDHFITPQHVKDVAHDVLRHRIILNYHGQAEGVKTDAIVSEILAKVHIP